MEALKDKHVAASAAAYFRKQLEKANYEEHVILRFPPDLAPLVRASMEADRLSTEFSMEFFGGPVAW
jgi:hypothetical protein